ncbi:hypothetical protein [Rhodothermus marinus]|uniref:hypothetical protein n=1 Tax=Rhodothermus marinus TaxID=29549 RepID=UPI0012BA433A|nr:hypothetical protein [Rhodothermus marinus]BBM69444.1 hypothetical protein RmaAA213_12900 [Rhodothermus marinus]BBM72426.1 hypothetical protein RmaAA338_12910 [Rhodothermus marinus]
MLLALLAPPSDTTATVWLEWHAGRRWIHTQEGSGFYTGMLLGWPVSSRHGIQFGLGFMRRLTEALEAHEIGLLAPGGRGPAHDRFPLTQLDGYVRLYVQPDLSSSLQVEIAGGLGIVWTEMPYRAPLFCIPEWCVADRSVVSSRRRLDGGLSGSLAVLIPVGALVIGGRLSIHQLFATARDVWMVGLVLRLRR